jgi:tetratricopeptide (TPR) repeat protein
MNYFKERGFCAKYSAVIFVMLILIFQWSCIKNGNRTTVAQKTEVANALAAKELYAQSINAYRQILESGQAKPDVAPGILNAIGDLYFERLKDYENSLAAYVELKTLYPESPLVSKVNKRIVECLERLQRSGDAIRTMSSMVSGDPSSAKDYSGFPVVAKIGERAVTLKEIEDMLGPLPDTLERKKEAVRQFILREVLYGSARRKGYGKEPEIIEKSFQFKKELMIQRILQNEFKDIKLDTADLAIFYKANAEKYTRTMKTDKGEQKVAMSYSEARPQVLRDYLMLKQQNALNQLMERLLSSEDIAFYFDRIEE